MCVYDAPKSNARARHTHITHTEHHTHIASYTHSIGYTEDEDSLYWSADNTVGDSFEEEEITSDASYTQSIIHT
jgi:hypothetical protein